jgi:hypothetical protein
MGLVLGILKKSGVSGRRPTNLLPDKSLAEMTAVAGAAEARAPEQP